MGLLTTKIKYIFDYYVSSSYHVSLCVISYIIVIFLLNGICINWVEISFIFCTTFFTYNFIKFYEFLTSNSRPFSISIKLNFINSLLFLIISLFLFFRFSINQQFVIAIVSFLTIAYTIPIYSNATLRNNPFLKIITVGLCWSLVIVVFPFIEILNGVDLMYHFIVVFCIVIVQMVPFEIRDIKKDEDSIRTVVLNYGTRKIKRVAYFILMFVFAFSSSFNYIFDKSLLDPSLITILFILGILILFCSDQQKKYYSSFFVESIPIYWLIIKFFL